MPVSSSILQAILNPKAQGVCGGESLPLLQEALTDRVEILCQSFVA